MGGLEALRPVEGAELALLPSRYAADEYGLPPPGPPPADLLTKEQFDSSIYKRPGLEWEDGETEARAAARAAVHDRNTYRDSLVARSDAGWLGQTAGFALGLGTAALDPTNYIPIIGPASKAAMVARFGRIGGALLGHGADAALNTGLFEPLAAATAQAQGRSYGWEEAGSDILTNALGGALLGTAAGEAARALGFGHGLPKTPDVLGKPEAPISENKGLISEVPAARETGTADIPAPIPEAGAGVVPRRPGQPPLRVDDLMRRADAAGLALDQIDRGEPVDVGKLLANDPAVRAPAAPPAGTRQAARVGDEVGRRLAAAGVPEAEARPQAALWQSFFDTMGRRAGIDPGALFDRYRVGVERGGVAEPGALFQFAGEKAQGAPLDALDRAKKLEAEGVDPREIWKREGWFKGADGKWRWEISDQEARIGKRAQEDIAEKGTTGKGRLPAVLWHKPLYEAYPHLREATAEIKQGSYTGGSGEWNLATRHVGIDVPGGDAARRSTALHEIQHAIQDHEGFAEGGSDESAAHIIERAKLAREAISWRKELATQPKGMDRSAKENAVVEWYRQQDAMDWLPSREARDLAAQPYIDDAHLAKIAAALGDKVDAKPREIYQRLAGEAEARAVQARADMTPEERRATFPLDSYDVPADQLIVRGAETLLQGGEGTARGSISFAHDGQTVIRLFEHADASTFLHESGHLFARVMRDLAERDGAPEGIARDWLTLRDWLGVKEGEGLGVEHEEKLARGFEAYLRDGEAPTPALKGVFETIKGWLRNVYKSLTDLGVTPSPEVRAVFDRMLGGEEGVGRPPSFATAGPPRVDVESTPAEEGGTNKVYTLRDGDGGELAKVKAWSGAGSVNVDWVGTPTATALHDAAEIATGGGGLEGRAYEAAKNRLGPRAMMLLAREIARDNPDAKWMSGYRVSGAREVAGEIGETAIDLDRFRRRGPMSLEKATPEPPHPSVAEAAPRVGKDTPELETFAKDAKLEGYDQPLPGHEPKPEPVPGEPAKPEKPPTPAEKAAATAALPPELGEVEAMRREGSLTPADEATLAAGEAEATRAESYADAWTTLVACVARNA